MKSERWYSGPRAIVPFESRAALSESRQDDEDRVVRGNVSKLERLSFFHRVHVRRVRVEVLCGSDAPSFGQQLQVKFVPVSVAVINTKASVNSYLVNRSKIAAREQ